MGETAEVLAREFGIAREEQDAFALRSHKLAAGAWNEGRMQGEVIPVPVPPRFDESAERDNGIRENQTLEALAKLKPLFDRRFGTVTAGNSSQITDGAVGARARLGRAGARARAPGAGADPVLGVRRLRSGADGARAGPRVADRAPARGRADDGPHGVVSRSTRRSRRRCSPA